MLSYESPSIVTHNDKKFKCTEIKCNASYNRPFKLKMHIRKHTGERPFSCDVLGCTKSYTNPAHLKRHKCIAHENSCEVMCGTKGCGLVFSNKYSLKKHINRKHNTSTYGFTCPECPEKFPKRKLLKQHLFFHTGEAPFKCSSCNIGFTTKYKYNEHIRNHKTYTCDCKEIFDRWSLFCAHRKNSCSIKRIDHKCIICNKTFTTKSNLTQHSLTHLEESQKELFRCPYMDCKRSYKYKKNLNYHIAVFHEKVNEEVKIKCTVDGCEQVLKTNKNLKNHILTVHRNKPKEKKKRNPRHDKGKSKKCMASIVTGINLTPEEHLNIIQDTNKIKQHEDAVTKNSNNGGNEQTNSQNVTELVAILPPTPCVRSCELLVSNETVVARLKELVKLMEVFFGKELFKNK